MTGLLNVGKYSVLMAEDIAFRLDSELEDYELKMIHRSTANMRAIGLMA